MVNHRSVEDQKEWNSQVDEWVELLDFIGKEFE
jgi:hypothetical protein